MRGAVIVALLTCGACSSPLEPSGAAKAPTAGHVVDPRLAPAWRLLASLPAREWTDGQTVGEWMDGLPPVRVTVEWMGWSIAGYHHDHVVIVGSATLADQPTAVVAALLAHELRHADGYKHTCGDKDTPGPWGAYAVQVDVLRQFGHASMADWFEQAGFCR